MNKKYLFNTLLLAGAAMFAACDYNEDNFDGLEEGHVPTDVKKLEYTMTEADYKAVSNNKQQNIPATKEDTIAFKNIGKHCAFSNAAPAAQYLPAFLAQKYYTADNGSVVKVTYEKDLEWSDEMKALNAASIYEVPDAKYELIWNDKFHFFTPTETAATYLPMFLKKDVEAEAGDMVFVDYQFSEIEPDGVAAALEEDFTDKWDGRADSVDVPGWVNIATKGTYGWNGKNFNDNNYVQASAFQHAAGECEIYMITPQIEMKKGLSLSFDACYGHYTEEGGRLSVWLLVTDDDLSYYSKEEIAAADWQDITDPLKIPVPEGNYGTLQNVYEKDLSRYAGKKAYIAFRYNGDGANGATTTVQLDNVVLSGVSSEGKVTLYRFDGDKWAEYTDAYQLTPEDYEEMGAKYNNFSSSFKAEDYLPKFLKNKYPYALEGAQKTVVYKFHAKEGDNVRADQYVFNAGDWTKAPKTETITDQFVLNNGEWKYDPSCVISLLPVRGDAVAVSYYQAATDWVWENIDVPAGVTKKGDGYVSHWGNNEYYSGCSAHYNNVDMRADKAREQNPEAYADMDDAEVVATMEKHLVEVMKGALEKMHSDVTPIEGIDIIFTVRMAVFTGVQLTDCNYEMKYKVSGPGTFEYVEDSYQPIEK